MSALFPRLGRSALERLADGLESGRVSPPYAISGLASVVSEREAPAVREALVDLAADGMSTRPLVRLVRAIAAERGAQQAQTDRVELVLSPPELDRVHARDTGVVTRELLRRARRSVHLASFAVDRADKLRSIVGDFAARMDADSDLELRLYVNVHRERDDGRPASELVRAFADHFRGELWPGHRLPAVFYDPRSVAPDGSRRAVLHAKCAVVDERWLFVSSANLTEAAQERNIEAGLLLDDPSLAARMRRQLDRLVEDGTLVPLFGSGGG